MRRLTYIDTTYPRPSIDKEESLLLIYDHYVKDFKGESKNLRPYVLYKVEDRQWKRLGYLSESAIPKSLLQLGIVHSIDEDIAIALETAVAQTYRAPRNFQAHNTFGFFCLKDYVVGDRIKTPRGTEYEVLANQDKDDSLRLSPCNVK